MSDRRGRWRSDEPRNERAPLFVGFGLERRSLVAKAQPTRMVAPRRVSDETGSIVDKKGELRGQVGGLRHELEVSSGSVELTDLIHRIEKRFAIVGRHAGIEVAATTPEQEVWATCTPALAERAVANLVQNAVEHNNEAGHVAVTLSLLDSGSRFRLVIADDGPGLPQETLASLNNESFLVDATPCVHRGDKIGKIGCSGCGSNRVVALYACAVHQRCTVLKTPKSQCCPCDEITAIRVS